METVCVLCEVATEFVWTVLFRLRNICTLNAGRIPVGARFFAHVQTGPEAHPASCTVGTGSFPGVKWPGRGADHPPPSSAEVKKE
jgi:hypothetical protein